MGLPALRRLRTGCMHEATACMYLTALPCSYLHRRRRAWRTRSSALRAHPRHPRSSWWRTRWAARGAARERRAQGRESIANLEAQLGSLWLMKHTADRRPFRHVVSNHQTILIMAACYVMQLCNPTGAAQVLPGPAEAQPHVEPAARRTGRPAQRHTPGAGGRRQIGQGLAGAACLDGLLVDWR